MKLQRIIDRRLLDTYAELGCVVCGTKPSDPDHVKTKGSGGDDVPENVWPLCRKHHDEKGKGLTTFVEAHPHLAFVLINKGWEYDPVVEKWRRYE